MSRSTIVHDVITCGFRLEITAFHLQVDLATGIHVFSETRRGIMLRFLEYKANWAFRNRMLVMLRMRRANHGDFPLDFFIEGVSKESLPERQLRSQLCQCTSYLHLVGNPQIVSDRNASVAV
jgi:hypothetical protein